MYWENQPELPSDKGSNWSRGATRDIGSPLIYCIYFIQIPIISFGEESASACT